MKKALVLALLASVLPLHAETKPLKALLITGGCCHDYAKQHVILSQGIQSRANVQVDVIWTDDKSTNPPLPVYDKADWAKGYDIIIHDECAASMNNKEVLTRILDAHKTIPAIHLHCAMHSFRTGEDRWFKHLGIQSASHGPQEPIAITFVDPEHPITKPLKDWTTIKEELYNNVNIFDGHPLAMGKQVVKGKDVDYVVAWTNEKVGARSFSTTIGHNNDTVADARYLDLVTRGLLWACDKLNADYLVPFKGENKVTFVAAKVVEAPKPPPTPKDATGIKASASSEETGKNNFAWKAVDGDLDTRWCASSPSVPQTLQLEFEKPQDLTGIKIVWESKNNAYRHKIEVENELGKARDWVADATKNTQPGDSEHAFDARKVKRVFITCTGTSTGGWASIKEVTFKGPNIKAVAPKLSAAQKKEYDKANDPLAKEGNVAPKIVKLTPEQEAAILKDVKVPEGFEVSLFAPPQSANYPVFVAAAPDGTLYVSSDGNGSLGRAPHRGRILRLRDLDGDGRADEVKEFVKDVDAPRGLVWDHDRLYLVHPPHLSAYIDKDGDGVADEEKVLVKNIAFGYDQRPADHTTNGLSLGIDGWLYIAGGDFGFMDAEGTDGRHLQHRGGGVIRVRPDGTGLEIYSTGTRNILEVAISPLMDIFARDNTNDGGGWNVRFHHFTGLDDHGYPRLFKNFPDECIQPLADYGGGSGCGAVYIDEPGFGQWNNAPFTCDWGTGALWHHQVKPKGATFEETRPPEPFIKMTRPTDADVDGNSRVYCASWKGATFNWEGPDVGYIVQVKPKGFKAEPLPDFAKASDEELVKVLGSTSNRRRMEAQRELVRREWGGTHQKLLESLNHYSSSYEIAWAVAQLGAVVNHAGAKGVLESSQGFTDDEMKLQWNISRHMGRVPVIKSKSDHGDQNAPLRINTMPRWVGQGPDDPSILHLSMIERFVATRDAEHLVSYSMPSELAGSSVLTLITVEASRRLGNDAANEWLQQLDHSKHSQITDLALRCLRVVHTPEVVTGLIERLGKATDPALRQGILAALCRLHFHEGEWKGDSWGTRPDTRGPYYQPEPWSETPKIAAALKDALAKASPEEAAFLVKEMNRNRIQSNDALERILVLAKQDAKVIPDAVAQLATAESIPAAAVPMLVGVVQEADKSVLAPVTLSGAIIALTKTDSAEGVSATLAALDTLKKLPESGKDLEAATNAFFNAPKLENHHQLVEQIAEKMEGATSLYADAALLNLANRKSGSPESIQLSQKALDAGWADAKRRKQIVEAIGLIKHTPSAGKVLAALTDPDLAVKKAAESAAKAMRLNLEKDTTPLVSTLKPEEVLAKVIAMKGDVATGEMVFTKATCIACHTTSESQPQKGPYLGNIAQTYKRPELAQNILDPNKTIAQGFASEVITLNDGTQQMGFITLESADNVKLRNVAAQEFTFAVKDIKSRQKLPISIMPPGLVNNLTLREFASLLDYLEALVKK